MRLLARFKFLRGTKFDPFGRAAERRTERALAAQYRAVIEELLPALSSARMTLATEIAAIPEHIRGYGHVKARHLKEAQAREAALLAKWRGSGSAPRHIEAAE